MHFLKIEHRRRPESPVGVQVKQTVLAAHQLKRKSRVRILVGRIELDRVDNRLILKKLKEYFATRLGASFRSERKPGKSW